MLRAVAGALLTPFVVASAVAPALAEPVAFGVSDAVVMRDTGGTAGLMLTLSPDSAARFAAFTIANVGRTVAIRIDGKTVMAPVIRDPIPGGVLRISGNFTRDELNDLAARLLSGAARVEAEVEGP